MQDAVLLVIVVAVGKRVCNALPEYCKKCPHLKLCWGECPKNRLVRTPSGEFELNYLCPGLKKFYAHIQRDMPQILRRVEKERGIGGGRN